MNLSATQFSASAFAPVNIAWIKYMGKMVVDGALQPSNPSLSMTLSGLGTQTQLRSQLLGSLNRSVEVLRPVEVIWDDRGYVPPLVGQEKVARFINARSNWASFFSSIDFEMFWPASVQIRTSNTAPAGTGIATSASSFAALTWAWLQILSGPEQEKFRNLWNHPGFSQAVSRLASLGSGSAARSLLGPWVEWSASTIVAHAFPLKWSHAVLIHESHPKIVSSTEAHRRVTSSPEFEGRADRASIRLEKIKTILSSSKAADQISELRNIVWEESEDMHSLFHTANPPFRYQTDETLRSVDRLMNSGQNEGWPSRNFVLTLDAGPNLHCFFPEVESDLWYRRLSEQFKNLQILQDKQGYGIRES